MKMRTKWWYLGVALVFLMVGVSCGAATPQLAEDRAPVPQEEAEMVEKPAASEPGGAGMAAIPEQRMVIYNGRLDLVVKDTIKAQEQIGTLVDDLEGYVLSTESYQREGGVLTVNMKVRVPAASFNTAMARLRDLALEVTYERVSSEDVTQEYVDLESRLRALEAKAAKLEELMEEAEDTEAVLQIYGELSATQEEIEHVKGRMRYLERSAAMATVEISLTPSVLAQPLEVAGWRPQGTAKRALQALIDTYRFLVDLLIWVVILVIPVLLGVGLVIYFFVKLLKRFFFRGGKKVRQKQEKPTPK
ncbi:MAG: DUF4349 domain-containing protein [Anaerolineae bacterium]